ncbi:HET-domain-containing protein [Cadophora sp. DSE1049]|nr:HET-domain-containing protein [Cadophora sp. DSE1049]
MRLLNTKTLLLEEFWDSTCTPNYAILSHTWEKQEVSFQAMADLEPAAQLLGFSKIQACCRLACNDGYEWIWIDTCCIDKSSSAELSEAINSMFCWYKEAATCYVYLADVPSDDDVKAPRSAFEKSRWFTRGWTLQELISPCQVLFFSKDWTRIGCRRSLSSRISEITRIDTAVLIGDETLLSKSIAQRMSWASRRSTTRIEDMAYCLLGIFDVNMPLLYGEGKKAFIRLQEEILKRSDDQSLFAWTAAGTGNIDPQTVVTGGFLASSPSDFERSCHYVPRNLRQEPYSMTNMGLCMTVPIISMKDHPEEEWLVLLGCGSVLEADSIEEVTFVGIYVVLDPIVELSSSLRVKQYTFARHYTLAAIGNYDPKPLDRW